MKQDQFLEELHREAFDYAHDDENGRLRLTAMTRTILDRLDDIGFLSDGQWAYYLKESSNLVAEVHAYSQDSEEDVLQLVYCIDAHEDVPLDSPVEVKSVSKDLIDRGFRRMEGFIKLVQREKLQDVEESQPVFELISLVRGSLQSRREISLHVLTTGMVSNRAAVFTDKDGLRRDVWDIARLSRECRGAADDRLSINFVDEFGDSLPCLVTDKSEDGVRILFTFIGGQALARVYEKYRARLLERNVRSFLQFTGKVNKGIRDTVLNAPARFLSYNNGLSATASSADLHDSKDGLARLLSVQDFQIVNGGQTTASIKSALRKDNANLSKVVVAMKLTIVPKEQVDELVPRISKYANTQNRIQESDFDANHRWHIAMERLSRSTWTAPTAESPHGTRWFYERSRGQYADELAKETTTAGRKKFRSENPSSQKFTKTDLAKFSMSWKRHPQIVSLGAQKCFARFMVNLSREAPPDPTEKEFKHIIALGILFKTAEKLYGSLGFTGYRANVVTYAIARLSCDMAAQLPFDEIWTSKSVPQEICDALKLLLTGIREEIIDRRPPNTNISEWCKKE